MKMGRMWQLADSAVLKVLVAEDQESFRLALKAKLGQVEGFSVVGDAKDGGQALNSASALHPDVVLMDIQMPFIDGIEATMRLKRQHPEIAIVMLTAHQDDDSIFAAFAAGADGYCLKGADTNRLMLAIRTVADGGAWLDPGIADRVLKQTSLRRPAGRTMSSTAEEKLALNLPLSPREKQILGLVADGLSNPQIARELSLKPETIKTHLGRIMNKLAVCDRTQAAVKALRQGIL